MHVSGHAKALVNHSPLRPGQPEVERELDDPSAGSARPATWPQEFSVRRCEAGDAADLWGLFNDPAYRHSGTLARFDDPDAVARWLAANRTGAFEIVGLHADVVVGFAGLYPFAGRQDHAGHVSLGVRSEAQGRGYGRALCRAILATADRVARLSRVQLNVFVDNARAIALYRSLGFAIEGRHACFGRRGTEFVDAFTMARLARQPATAGANPALR